MTITESRGRMFFLAVLLFAGLLTQPAQAQQPAAQQPAAEQPATEQAPKQSTHQRDLPSAAEAPGRARLLHEAIHATLQIVHHEYYREDEALKLPAATLQSVFQELATRQKVELRWLAVNAQAMNVDHVPRTDFEKQAVQALSAGQAEFTQQTDQALYYAGAITLDSSCLKCHAPTRTSNRDRAAALVIKMPLRQP
jgi:hypothetical protein